MIYPKQELFDFISLLSTTPAGIENIAKDMGVDEYNVMTYIKKLRGSGWEISYKNRKVSLDCQQLTLLQDYYSLCDGNMQYDLSPESLIAQIVRLRRKG